jgi:hypothetical protein
MQKDSSQGRLIPRRSYRSRASSAEEQYGTAPPCNHVPTPCRLGQRYCPAASRLRRAADQCGTSSELRGWHFDKAAAQQQPAPFPARAVGSATRSLSARGSPAARVPTNENAPSPSYSVRECARVRHVCVRARCRDASAAKLVRTSANPTASHAVLTSPSVSPLRPASSATSVDLARDRGCCWRAPSAVR